MTDKMTRQEFIDDLGGPYEVAQTLDVPYSRVHRWIERRASTGCPEPLLKLRNVHLYSISDWQGWHALWRVTRGAETWWTGTEHRTDR